MNTGTRRRSPKDIRAAGGGEGAAHKDPVPVGPWSDAEPPGSGRVGPRTDTGSGPCSDAGGGVRTSNDEITARLRLSMGTVKTHVGRLLAKLAARDRAQLVIAAYESGVVSATDHGPDRADAERGAAFGAFYGLMFWFRWNRFPASYVRFTSTRRS